MEGGWNFSWSRYCTPSYVHTGGPTAISAMCRKRCITCQVQTRHCTILRDLDGLSTYNYIILCKLCYFASLKVDLAVTLKYLPGSRHTGQHCPVGSGLEQLVGGQCTFSHCTIDVCDSRMEGAAREEGKRNIKVVIAHSR